MNDYQNFSSLPPELERQFVVYERRTQESAKKAWTMAYISAAAFGVLLIIVVMAFPAPKNIHAEELENIMKEEEKPREKAPPPPAPAPEPAPAADTPTEGAAGEAGEAAEGAEGAAAAEGEAAAPAEGAAEAPPPPKGATKAPPTALIGK